MVENQTPKALTLQKDYSIFLLISAILLLWRRSEPIQSASVFSQLTFRPEISARVLQSERVFCGDVCTV